jgi:hypothetical protein
MVIMEMVRTLIHDGKIVSTKLSGTFDAKTFLQLSLDTYALPHQERILAYLWDWNDVDMADGSTEQLRALVQRRQEMRAEMADPKPAIYVTSNDLVFGLLRMGELADTKAGTDYSIFVYKTIEEAQAKIDEILGR